MRWGIATTTAATGILRAVELYDWLLLGHVISAFGIVASLTVLWVMVLATRPAAATLGPEEAGRLGAFAGPLVGITAGLTLVFGIALAVERDEYGIFDGWILASIVLWVAASATGQLAGKALAEDPVGGRSRGVGLHALSSVIVVVILVLMIWKPGA